MLIRLIDVDIRTVIRALAAYLDRPVTFGALNDIRVTLETPQPVPRSNVPLLLRGLLESQNMQLTIDSVGGFYRVHAVQAQRAPPAARQAGPPTQGAQTNLRLWVVRLSHARAEDVAATVNALFGRGTALGELGDQRSTLSDQLRDTRIPPTAPRAGRPSVPGPPGGAEQPVPGGAVPGVTQAALSGEVTIVPDPGSNSLLIRASEADFALIEAAIEQVDVRPLQVLIEVLIAEARKDRSLAFGVETDLPVTRVPNTSDTEAEGSILGVGLADFALRVMNVGGYDIDATLRAAAARGDVAIISRPILLAANNEPAEILVGSQRPFVQVSRSLPTDLPQRDQVIQYRDVGTQLRILPTISADGYVMLEVIQEVNAATNEVQFDAPVISTRSVSTRLLIRDGQTVVLGGLTDRQRDNNQSGVPFLSSIPLLGGLFGRASRRTNETELLLFLTPRVIRTDQDVEAATDSLRRRAERIKP